jgi:hypothetical protein
MFSPTHTILPLLLVSSLFAQESQKVSETPNLYSASSSDSEATLRPRQSKNEFFIQPTLTILTILIDELPLTLSGTLEHHLPNGKSVIWQPQIQLGKIDDDVATVSLFAFGNYLGLRSYLNGSIPHGVYLQGSIAVALGSIDAEHKNGINTASAFMQAYGALGYVGYRWSKVFWDIGAGYQTASGTLKFDTGEELDIQASGLALDLNLGFTF